MGLMQTQLNTNTVNGDTLYSREVNNANSIKYELNGLHNNAINIMTP